MSDATVEEVEEEPKSSKMPLILGIVAALVGGGGGFFAAFSGIILAPESPAAETYEEPEVAPLPDVTYVPIEPMIISIGSATNKRHLRFSAQLEVPKEYQADVESVVPRVMDVFNGYLRAVRVEDLESSTALIRFRTQLLHRIDIVAGRGRVNDLLITEFVLN